jgi:hypothetical protein
VPPLPPPLGVRVLEGLLGHAFARLAAHQPGWTDAHESDPGVTLLELLAFLGEELDAGARKRRRRRAVAIAALASLASLLVAVWWRRRE